MPQRKKKSSKSSTRNPSNRPFEKDRSNTSSRSHDLMNSQEAGRSGKL